MLHFYIKSLKQSLFLAIFATSFLNTFELSAQNLTKIWDKRFGGTDVDICNSVIAVDGGFLLVGTSSSPADGDKTQASQGDTDFWIVKTDGVGTKQWDRRYGGSSIDNINSVLKTSDGGYLLVGHSNSPISGDKSQAARSLGINDFWVVKIDAAGTKQWDARFGSTGQESCSRSIATSDGGYILLGSADNAVIGGDKTVAPKGGIDVWAVKINASGTKVWDNVLGGSLVEYGNDIVPASDGGFLIGGYSNSNISGDKSQASQGGDDFWVVKIDGTTGAKVWDKRFGGTGNEQCRRIVPTADGGYLLAGRSDSPISGDKTEGTQGSADYWVVKIDVNGNKLWDKRFGGSSFEALASALPTPDGGFLLVGDSSSPISGDKTEGAQGSADYWAVAISATGDKIWDKRFGGTAIDLGYDAIIISPWEYLFVGQSASVADGDKTENTQGMRDYWVVRTNIVCTPIVGFAASSSPTSIAVGSSSTLNSSATSGILTGTTTFNWFGSGSFSATTQGPSTGSLATAGAYIYMVNANNPNGIGTCTATATASLSVSVVSTPSVALSLKKTANNMNPVSGNTVIYTIIITNSGPDNATGVKLKDTLPAGVTFGSVSTGVGTYNTGTGVWDIGNVPVGQTTITMTVTIN